ncbi:hypothetical protein [Peribacillus butanolivorans]|uniref:hypothetical protein n=1 Tax=Peribacillus butanolivorans TaxID=421767 RepID=UPI0036626938
MLLSLLLIITGCSGSSESSSSKERDVIKIGVIEAFSGPNAQTGQETFNRN